VICKPKDPGKYEVSGRMEEGREGHNTGSWVGYALTGERG